MFIGLRNVGKSTNFSNPCYVNSIFRNIHTYFLINVTKNKEITWKIETKILNAFDCLQCERYFEHYVKATVICRCLINGVLASSAESVFARPKQRKNASTKIDFSTRQPATWPVPRNTTTCHVHQPVPVHVALGRSRVSHARHTIRGTVSRLIGLADWFVTGPWR